MTDPLDWGLQAKFRDFRGETHKVSTDVVARVMEAMGAEPNPPSDGPIVIRRGQTKAIKDAVRVETEGGGSTQLDDGRLPPDVPLGYHSIVRRDGGTQTLIVSPGSCFLPEDLNVWGFGVQLYSARSNRSWGIGDLGDLLRLGNWAKRAGAGVLLLNPLHASRPRIPQEPSPYSPSSRCFKNVLYIDIDALPTPERDRDSIDLLAEKARRLNALDAIDRDAAYRLKLEALEQLWKTADRTTEDFKRYCAESGELLSDFATFMSAAEGRGKERVDFHIWVQWMLDEQLERASQTINLIHDMAIGVDPDGADSWLWEDTFVSGVAIGAPPDEFNSLGQNWGMRPFDPWKLRSSGYEPFIRTIRACMRGAAGLRIDHIMWLFRLWWIPDGHDPSEGVYVHYPHDDLLDILALESHRAGCYVVGEDLGTVDPLVRKEMHARNILSTKLMWFEGSPPEDYPELSFAAVTTHDLPTVAGLWTGTDLKEQQGFGVEPDVQANQRLRAELRDRLDLKDDAPVEEVTAAVYRSLAKAPSRVVIATLEDALGVHKRPNLPGTVDRPNWSLPLPVPIDELDNHPLARSVTRALVEGRS